MALVLLLNLYTDFLLLSFTCSYTECCYIVEYVCWVSHLHVDVNSHSVYGFPSFGTIVKIQETHKIPLPLC